MPLKLSQVVIISPIRSVPSRDKVCKHGGDSVDGLGLRQRELSLVLQLIDWQRMHPLFAIEWTYSSVSLGKARVYSDL